MPPGRGGRRARVWAAALAAQAAAVEKSKCASQPTPPRPASGESATCGWADATESGKHGGGGSRQSPSSNQPPAPAAAAAARANGSGGGGGGTVGGGPLAAAVFAMKAQSSAKKRRLAALNEHHGSSGGGGSGGARAAGAPQTSLTQRRQQHQQQQPQQQQQQQQQQKPAAGAAAAGAAPAPPRAPQATVAGRQAAAEAAAGGAAALQAASQPAQQPPPPSRATTPAAAAAPGGALALGAFPYNPLPATLASSHLVAAMLLPAPAPAGGAPGGAGRAARAGVEDLLEALMLPHMAPSAASAMLASRLGPDKAVLLDNPTAKLNLTRPGAAARGRARLMAGRLLPRRRRAELTALPALGLDGSAMLALHGLWSNYAEQLLAAGKHDPRRALQGADWHGAALRVSAHCNPTYLGRVGVVAKATANTLVLVSPEGRASTVPIKGATFEGVAPGLSAPFTLEGASLATLQCSLQDGGGGG